MKRLEKNKTWKELKTSTVKYFVRKKNSSLVNICHQCKNSLLFISFSIYILTLLLLKNINKHQCNMIGTGIFSWTGIFSFIHKSISTDWISVSLSRLPVACIVGKSYLSVKKIHRSEIFITKTKIRHFLLSSKSSPACSFWRKNNLEKNIFQPPRLFQSPRLLLNWSIPNTPSIPTPVCSALQSTDKIFTDKDKIFIAISYYYNLKNYISIYSYYVSFS